MTEPARRILMSTDTVGGVWSYNMDLLREFASINTRTLLVSQGGMPSDEQRAEASQINCVELVPTDYKLEWMQDPWSDVARAGDLMLQLQRSFQPDIVHLNGFAHASLPFKAPKLAVAHSCVLSWWRAVHAQAAPRPEWTRYHAEVEAGLNAADKVVAPTQSMLDALTAEYSYTAPTKVIYNGSPMASGHLQGVKKEKLVFAAGRVWDQAKNIAALHEASRFTEAPVYIAGDQAENDCLSVEESKNVNLLGRLSRPEVAEWMQRAEIYCLPVLYEPFGLSILEAARAGCALVVGDIPSMRELWDENCACFVDPRDPRAIAESINSLLHDDDRRARLQKNARERAARYMSSRMAHAYIAEYNQLLCGF